MDLNINVEEHYKAIDQTKNNTTNMNDNLTQQEQQNKFLENYDLTQYGLPLEEVYNMARSFFKGILMDYANK